MRLWVLFEPSVLVDVIYTASAGIVGGGASLLPGGCRSPSSLLAFIDTGVGGLFLTGDDTSVPLCGPYWHSLGVALLLLDDGESPDSRRCLLWCHPTKTMEKCLSPTGWGETWKASHVVSTDMVGLIISWHTWKSWLPPWPSLSPTWHVCWGTSLQPPKCGSLGFLFGPLLI